jgi:hypothetical protein
LFKSFHQPNVEPDGFTIDQRDIEEQQVREVSAAAPADVKKLKRTANPSDANNNAIVQCDICQVPITSQIVYDTHIKGKKHLNLLATRLKVKKT